MITCNKPNIRGRGGMRGELCRELLSQDTMLRESLMKIFALRCFLSILFAVLVSSPGFSAEARSPSSSEWERTIEPAKKEGKLVAAIPASAELRKAIGEIFPKRFPGIELELTNARGPSNASKIAAEHAAGVRYYDL